MGYRRGVNDAINSTETGRAIDETSLMLG
jgi:hypothetical protein